MATDLELFSQLEALMELGDEPKVRGFLADNINEFSQEVREKIIAAFFTDALEHAMATTAVQLKGSEAMETLMSVKAEVEKQNTN